MTKTNGQLLIYIVGLPEFWVLYPLGRLSR